MIKGSQGGLHASPKTDGIPFDSKVVAAIVRLTKQENQIKDRETSGIEAIRSWRCRKCHSLIGTLPPDVEIVAKSVGILCTACQTCFRVDTRWRMASADGLLVIPTIGREK